MLTSSIANSVTFKDLTSGTFPNKWNTLHENRKHAGFTILPYCKKFNKDDVIYLQFTSDVATLPNLNIYNPVLNDTIAATLASSYSGTTDRYFFNFEITLDSDYYDKKVYFTVEQGDDLLTSEPIYCEDISSDIAKGRLKRIKYTNLDRIESDLLDYWIDWSVVDYMYFYIEAIDLDVNDFEENEVLEGSQSKTNVYSKTYSGVILKTGGIPDYFVDQLKVVSGYDYFEVNEIQYIKDKEVEPTRFGNSTLFQCEISLTEKNTIGLNVDDLGVTLTDTIMAIIPKRNTAVTPTGWEVENPEGYMLHSVFVKHALTSAADATLNLGITIGGDELIDDIQGEILQSEYSSVWKQFPAHYLKNPDAATILYVSVSGVGAVLDIIINFDTVTQQ